jgi:hypothetical protein
VGCELHARVFPRSPRERSHPRRARIQRSHGSDHALATSATRCETPCSFRACAPPPLLTSPPPSPPP